MPVFFCPKIGRFTLTWLPPARPQNLAGFRSCLGRPPAPARPDPGTPPPKAPRWILKCLSTPYLRFIYAPSTPENDSENRNKWRGHFLLKLLLGRTRKCAVAKNIYAPIYALSTPDLRPSTPGKFTIFCVARNYSNLDSRDQTGVFKISHIYI